MTDLLAAQAEIKSRRLTRDPSGRFIRPDKAKAQKLAKDLMKASLLRELEAYDHERGIVRVRPYERHLPNALQVAGTEEAGTLFDRVAA